MVYIKLKSYKVIPKRKYLGAYGYRVGTQLPILVMFGQNLQEKKI